MSAIHHKNRTDRAIEEVVINMSIANPHMGQQKVSIRMRAEFGIDISVNGVRNIWFRNQLDTTQLRIEKFQYASIV